MQTLYDEVSCSQCGRSFGPGHHGFSHCEDHPGHVQDMAEYKRRLLSIADTIMVTANTVDPRLDEPCDIGFLLGATAVEFRSLIAEMKRNGHDGKKEKVR